jgi:hypothetical protein
MLAICGPINSTIDTAIIVTFNAAHNISDDGPNISAIISAIVSTICNSVVGPYKPTDPYPFVTTVILPIN